MTEAISPWRAFPADPHDWYSPEEIERSRRYARPVRWVTRASAVVAGLWLLLVTVSHVVPKAIDALGVGWVLGVVVAVAIAAGGDVVVTAPFGAWRELGYDKRWGFSTQTTGGFVGDLLKSLPLAVVINAVLFLPLWWLMRSTALWWLWGWLVFAAFVVAFGVLYPVLVAPIFNKYTPLDDGPLRKEILATARQVDADIADVLVEDASRRDTRVNAYVAGLGRTRRVVLYDTMVVRPHDEVVSVVAHEIGHWKLKHLRRTIPVVVGLALVNFVVLKLVLESAWVQDVAGAHEGVGDPALVPVFLLVFPAATAVTRLVSSWVSRGHERQADLFSLATTRAPGAFVRAFASMSRDNLMELTPSPLKRLLASHPPVAERMAMGTAWGEAAGIVSDDLSTVGAVPPGPGGDQPEGAAAGDDEPAGHHEQLGR